MEDFLIDRISKMDYPTKESIAGVGLLALGVSFEWLSGASSEMQKEISNWRDGLVFSIGVLPDGPAVTLEKKRGRIVYLGRGFHDPELGIYFKNMDSGLLVFLGLMGAHTAAVQRRTIIHGNVVEAVRVVRAMNVVQKYLFPGFVVNRTFKRAPEFGFTDYIIKGMTYAGLLPNMLLKWNR